MLEILNKLGAKDVNGTLVNLGLIFALLLPIITFLAQSFKSLIYDSFDLQLMSKERKQRFYLSRQLLLFLLGSLLFVGSFISLAFWIAEFKLFNAFFLALAISSILFVLWSIFYLIIFPLFLINKLCNFEDTFKKCNYAITVVLLLLIGTLFGAAFVGFLLEDDYNNPLMYFTFLPMFIVGVSIFMVGNLNIPFKTAKYKFKSFYKGETPHELFLDYQLDSNTSVLSSLDGKFKAIKYNKLESSDYIIELYEKVTIVKHFNQDNSYQEIIENNSISSEANQ
ncbi:hypothetical protein [Lysinibacillus fusiformis]|uniref:hypothetical protein n=1 Tax=Lysinibacillus fusiformis TaxID=28031 RepID=UPI0035C181C1|nr:hypothetical protein QYY55_23585 [Lysinibacillus fusiformis]